MKVSVRGTPKSMLWLDSQMLKMEWRIIQLKLRAIVKTMGKPKNTLCRKAVIAGEETCNSEDLLTECMAMCKKLDVKCVSHGVPNTKEQFSVKKAFWNENYSEIIAELDKSDKVRSIVIPKFQKNKLLENNESTRCKNMVQIQM